MYLEGEIPYVSNGNGNGNGMWGQDGIWAILLLALLGFGRGYGGYGLGGGNGSGNEFVGYELGKVATQADIASGFANSATLSSLNDIKLGQANMQNFINQGFSGINTQLLSGFHGVDNAICTLGYQNQSGFNTLAHQISDCCCGIQRSIDGLNYNMAKNTCDIIQAGHNDTQHIFDYLTGKENEALRAEIVALKGRISNDAQSAYLLDKLGYKCPIPAYVVPNPNCCYQNHNTANTISGVL